MMASYKSAETLGSLQSMDYLSPFYHYWSKTFNSGNNGLGVSGPVTTGHLHTYNNNNYSNISQQHHKRHKGEGWGS